MVLLGGDEILHCSPTKGSALLLQVSGWGWGGQAEGNPKDSHRDRNVRTPRKLPESCSPDQTPGWLPYSANAHVALALWGWWGLDCPLKVPFHRCLLGIQDLSGTGPCVVFIPHQGLASNVAGLEGVGDHRSHVVSGHLACVSGGQVGV